MHPKVDRERGMRLWREALVHDKAGPGMGGTFTVIIGDFGSGKSTLLMQVCELTRYVNGNKEHYFAHPERYRLKNETVYYRMRPDEMCNSLWEPFVRTWWPAPKPCKIHIHENDKNRVFFYHAKTSEGQEVKVQNLPPIALYGSMEELYRNTKKQGINLVIEPQEYAMSPEFVQKLRTKKMEDYNFSLRRKYPRKKKKKDRDGTEDPIRAPPSIFWYEYIDYFLQEKDETNYTFVMDEASQVFPMNARGDRYDLQEIFISYFLDLRKNNTSMVLASQDLNYLDYRIVDRFPFRVWLKGAIPPKRGSMVHRSLPGSLLPGEGIVEKKLNEWGGFDFLPIRNAPPTLKIGGLARLE